MTKSLKLDLAENLTINTVQSQRDSLLSKLIADDVSSIVLNLSQVKHCDTAGLALLIELKRLCNKHAKSVSFAKVPDRIAALATFCGVSEILV